MKVEITNNSVTQVVWYKVQLIHHTCLLIGLCQAAWLRRLSTSGTGHYGVNHGEKPATVWWYFLCQGTVTELFSCRSTECCKCKSCYLSLLDNYLTLTSYNAKFFLCCFSLCFCICPWFLKSLFSNFCALWYLYNIVCQCTIIRRQVTEWCELWCGDAVINLPVCVTVEISRNPYVLIGI